MNSAVRKGLAIIGVAVLLLFPLAWLHSLVSERTALREQAVAAVARGWGGQQLLSGPILAIPVTTTGDDGRSHTRDWYVLPESLDLDAEVTVQAERRKLGVYEVPIYVATIHITGQFDLPHEIAKLTTGNESIRVHADSGRLLLPLSDPRGVREIKPVETEVTSTALEPWPGFPIAALAAPLRPDLS